MDCIVTVQKTEDGGRVLLPFDVSDGPIMAVKELTTGARRLNLFYPEKWDEARARMSGYELSRFDYGHGVANFDFISRPLRIEGNCVVLDSSLLAYIGAERVKVAQNGYRMTIEPFAARLKVKNHLADPVSELTIYSASV